MYCVFRSATVSVVSYGCCTSSNLVHRSLELLHCSILIGCCPQRHSGLFLLLQLISFILLRGLSIDDDSGQVSKLRVAAENSRFFVVFYLLIFACIFQPFSRIFQLRCGRPQSPNPHVHKMSHFADTSPPCGHPLWTTPNGIRPNRLSS